MDFGGLEFLVPILSHPDVEVVKSALRGVSNMALYYGICCDNSYLLITVLVTDEIRKRLGEQGAVTKTSQVSRLIFFAR